MRRGRQHDDDRQDIDGFSARPIPATAGRSSAPGWVLTTSSGSPCSVTRFSLTNRSQPNGQCTGRRDNRQRREPSDQVFSSSRSQRVGGSVNRCAWTGLPMPKLVPTALQRCRIPGRRAGGALAPLPT
jgi:hypothetical protein